MPQALVRKIPDLTSCSPEGKSTEVVFMKPEEIMSERFNSAVTPHLDDLGISYEAMEVPLDPEKKPIRSLEEILASQCRNPGQIVRSPVTRASLR